MRTSTHRPAGTRSVGARWLVDAGTFSLVENDSGVTSTEAEAVALAMVEATIERFGRVDVMFANAGIYIPGQAIEGDPDAWTNLMKVNIDGVMYCVHAVLEQMQSQGSGDILVSSSISGFVDIEWEPIYSASKHAVNTLVHTLRRQVAPLGLRVGLIAPGPVATELWDKTDPDEIAQLADVERSFIRAEDVARAVVFMLSQPPYVTVRDLVILPQTQDI